MPTVPAFFKKFRRFFTKLKTFEDYVSLTPIGSFVRFPKKVFLLYLSTSYLSDLIKKETGKTVKEHVPLHLIGLAKNE